MKLCWHFNIYEQEKLHAQLSKLEKSFITLGSGVSCGSINFAMFSGLALFRYSEKKIKIWVLWSFQEYFTSIKAIVSQSWAKTGVPEKNHLTYQCRTWHLTCTLSEALDHWTTEACLLQ